MLAQLGLASRREAESWIRAGRLTVNGRPAALGMRVMPQEQIRLDGRLVRRRPQAAIPLLPVLMCHRSPGEPLLEPRQGPAPAARADTASAAISMAARLPRRAGRRFISISPMPTVDGGLELLTADGAEAAHLQRAMRTIEMEFSLRVRGELDEQQRQAIAQGQLDDGSVLQIVLLEPAGGEGSNRWYRLVAVGASGNQVRQLIERAGVTLVRLLRTRIGSLTLPRSVPRGRWRELEPAELARVTTAARAVSAAGSPDSAR